MINKIFIIGFGRTGTRYLHYFFKKNNLKSIHWDNRNLVSTFEKNIKENKPLLYNGFTQDIKVNSECSYENALVFSDFCDDILNKYPSDYYKILDKQYPNSKFILSYRHINNWIASKFKPERYKHILNQLLYHKCNEKELEIILREKYEKHYDDVLNYFKDRKDDLIIFDIEKDNINKLIKFLERDYNLKS